MLIRSDVVSTREVVRRQGWVSSGCEVGVVGAAESVVGSGGVGGSGVWM